MRQSRAKMIAGAVEKYLRFVFQTAEPLRMNDSRAITLIFRAERMMGFAMPSTGRFGGTLGKRSERTVFLLLHHLTRSLAARHFHCPNLPETPGYASQKR